MSQFQIKSFSSIQELIPSPESFFISHNLQKNREHGLQHQQPIEKNTLSQDCHQLPLQNQQNRKKFKKSRDRFTKSVKVYNHNFQKHTVITIKKLGQKLCQKFGKSSVQLVAYRMWNIFLQSGINSKKILIILFGKANIKQQKCKELFRNCYFGEMCSYDQNLLHAAQQLLRERLLQLTSDELVRNHTKKWRNIHQKQQFVAYFLEFMEQLKHGPIIKSRIGSASTNRIGELIRVEKKLNKIQIRRKKPAIYQQL